MGRGLGKIQRIILHILSQYPTGLSFSTLKRMVPEDISRTKGYRPSHPKFVPQHKFDHNIYMALKALAKRGLIEIVPPYWAKNRIHRITQRGIEYVERCLTAVNIKMTSGSAEVNNNYEKCKDKDIVEVKHSRKSISEVEVPQGSTPITPEITSKLESLYNIIRQQASTNTFNLSKLLEMGYDIRHIAIAVSKLERQGILSHEQWEETLEAWHKQRE